MPITINGTGTVTGISAGGLPDGCIVTADLADGAATPAKTTGGPAFSASANSDTSVSNVTFTKVDLLDEEFDTANCFSSSRFTPNVAGYYIFTMGVQASAVAQLAPVLYVNGSQRYWGVSVSGTTFDSAGACIQYMNGTTDYAEMYVYQASGSTILVKGFKYRTFFQAFLARPA